MKQGMKQTVRQKIHGAVLQAKQWKFCFHLVSIIRLVSSKLCQLVTNEITFPFQFFFSKDDNYCITYLS